MSINACMNRFLVASRGVFNQFFFQEDCLGDTQRAWELNDLFKPVERALFEALVVNPLNVGTVSYGEVQPRLAVCPNGDFDLPIMLNREISGGYWDHPIDRSPATVQLRFICFFDWSNIDRRDNRYVRVRVFHWPGKPELVGKDGLIETRNIRYELIPLETILG